MTNLYLPNSIGSFFDKFRKGNNDIERKSSIDSPSNKSPYDERKTSQSEIITSNTNFEEEKKSEVAI